MNPEYHIHISADHSLLDLKFSEAYKYRGLIWLFAKKNFVKSYKQTVLGPLWLIISPLMTSLIHTLIFGTVAGIETDGVPKILFYLLSNAIWNFMNSNLTGSSNTFISNSSIFGKVYFPRLIMPLSNMLIQAIHFLIQFVIFIVCGIVFALNGEFKFTIIGWIWIPVVLVWMGAMGIGLGLIASGLTKKYRDLRFVVNYGVSLWRYGSPVVYPLSKISGGLLRKVMLINPASAPMDFSRAKLLGTEMTIPGWSIALSVVFSIVIFFVGVIVFNKAERNFLDTI